MKETKELKYIIYIYVYENMVINEGRFAKNNGIKVRRF